VNPYALSFSLTPFTRERGKRKKGIFWNNRGQEKRSPYYLQKEPEEKKKRRGRDTSADSKCSYYFRA